MVATVERIVAGGQTGVDRAALDAALAAGVAAGGWCPRGRRAEDGPIPARYPLQETAGSDYTERTCANVRDADGTLILAWGELAGGTRLAADCAHTLGRPWLSIDLAGLAGPAGRGEAVAKVCAWLAGHRIRTLNVAGPRASEAPEVYAAAHALMAALLVRA